MLRYAGLVPFGEPALSARKALATTESNILREAHASQLLALDDDDYEVSEWCNYEAIDVSARRLAFCGHHLRFTALHNMQEVFIDLWGNGAHDIRLTSLSPTTHFGGVNFYEPDVIHRTDVAKGARTMRRLRLAIAHLERQKLAVRVIKRRFRAALYDPENAICKRRLAREFEELDSAP